MEVVKKPMLVVRCWCKRERSIALASTFYQILPGHPLGFSVGSPKDIYPVDMFQILMGDRVMNKIIAFHKERD